MLKPLAFLHKMLLFHILRNILFVLYKSYNSLQFTQPIHLSLVFADLNNLLLGHRYGYVSYQLALPFLNCWFISNKIINVHFKWIH